MLYVASIYILFFAQYAHIYLFESVNCLSQDFPIHCYLQINKWKTYVYRKTTLESNIGVNPVVCCLRGQNDYYISEDETVSQTVKQWSTPILNE